MQEQEVKENLFKALKDFLDCDGIMVHEAQFYPRIPYNYRVTKEDVADIFSITFYHGHTIELDLNYFPDDLVQGLIRACSKKAELYKKHERAIMQQKRCANLGVSNLILPFGTKCEETQCVLRDKCDMYKQVLQYQKQTAKQK